MENMSMKISSPAYFFRPGDWIPVTWGFDYKGKPQDCALTFEIGDGVYPTFNSKKKWSPLTIALDGYQDWERQTFETQFQIPTNWILFKLFNIRGTARTKSDVTQEIATDWGVIEIVLNRA